MLAFFWKENGTPAFSCLTGFSSLCRKSIPVWDVKERTKKLVLFCFQLYIGYNLFPPTCLVWLNCPTTISLGSGEVIMVFSMCTDRFIRFTIFSPFRKERYSHSCSLQASAQKSRIWKETFQKINNILLRWRKKTHDNRNGPCQTLETRRLVRHSRMYGRNSCVD